MKQAQASAAVPLWAGLRSSTKPMAGAALLLLCSIFPLLDSTAQAAGPGTSAATFLSLGFGARPLALGESFVALADDASALHYNPAGLSLPQPASPQGRRPYELLLSHSLHIQDIRLTQMGFMRRPFGLSVTHLSLRGIERRTSETAEPDGSFGASDLAVGLSYGRRVGKVGVGGTVKFVQQRIGEYSASAYALDIGALYRLKSAPVTLGAGLGNLGTKVKFIEEGYPLPMTARLGASVGQTKSFPHALSFEVDLPRDNAPVFRVGVEYLGFGPFAMRAGYRSASGAQRDAVLGKALGSTASGLSEFYGMFMGAGFRSKALDFDYTLLPYGELGNAHR
ncbi:MAG: PorV/PorQ family protein, partial [Elusimicrobia bacterium]|nr:PorV/PorQ family protein [Elusimicrobiota bacterium]